MGKMRLADDAEFEEKLAEHVQAAYEKAVDQKVGRLGNSCYSAVVAVA